jgi:hypothetical protein
VTALLVGALGPKDLRGRSETLACTRPGLALSRLPAILKARDPILMQTPDETPWEGDMGRLVVVSDGSLAAAALLAAVADRVESTANIEDRRRLLAEREAEVASSIDPAGATTTTRAPSVRSAASSSTPATKRESAATTPEQAVLAALDKRIAALAIASQRLEVVAASGKGRSVLCIDPSRLEVQLDLQSPLGKRLIAAQEQRNYEAVADALDLMAAHVAGELDILYDAVKPEHHLRAVMRLLEAAR